MQASHATLKVLLPFRIFSEVSRVTRMVAETDEGKVHYLAVNEGILVKMGALVRLSVRNAIRGDDLQTLKETVEREFKVLESSERDLRSAMARIEIGLIRTLKQFHDS